jgi:hypothetical protein
MLNGRLDCGKRSISVNPPRMRRIAVNVPKCLKRTRFGEFIFGSVGAALVAKTLNTTGFNAREAIWANKMLL